MTRARRPSRAGALTAALLATCWRSRWPPRPPRTPTPRDSSGRWPRCAPPPPGRPEGQGRHRRGPRHRCRRHHPDLTGSVLTGKDLIGFGAGPGDATWARHGTAMAGIIAGHGHGPGDADGVMGIAPQARILPVRVILEDTDPQRKKARASRGGALAEGIRWAADHGADVINLSLGDDSRTAHPDAAEDNAVQYALRKGIVVVASAGNNGQHGSPVSYPAAYPGVLAVTAVDHNDRHAAFSTSRWYAAVAAPGVDVVIADPDTHYYEGWGTARPPRTPPASSPCCARPTPGCPRPDPGRTGVHLRRPLRRPGRRPRRRA